MSEYYYNNNFDLAEPPKGLGNSEGPRTTLRIVAL